MAGRVHDLQNPASQCDFVSLLHQAGGAGWRKRVAAGIESLEWDRINQNLWELVAAVLYLRSPGHREVLPEEAGELTLPGQECLLIRMNKPLPEFMHTPDVIVVRVSRDRDHPPTSLYEAIEHPSQRSNSCARVHDQISLRSVDVKEVRSDHGAHVRLGHQRDAITHLLGRIPDIRHRETRRIHEQMLSRTARGCSPAAES